MGGATVQLITMQAFPSSYAIQFGTVVVARSVKRLPERQVRRKLIEEMHDSWWNELREEAMNHCRHLNCGFVCGYTETCTINANEDICVLSAVGTAANIEDLGEKQPASCRCCHVTYQNSPIANQVALHTCGECGNFQVPECILSTTEPPSHVVTVGEPVRIEAMVMRPKKHVARDEGNAQVVSELLPFIEYDLHRQLLLKLRVAQRNAAFGLTVQLSLSDERVIAVSTATAINLKPLPMVRPLRLTTGVMARSKEMASVVRAVHQLSQHNIALLNQAEECSMVIPTVGKGDSALLGVVPPNGIEGAGEMEIEGEDEGEGEGKGEGEGEGGPQQGGADKARGSLSARSRTGVRGRSLHDEWASARVDVETPKFEMDPADDFASLAAIAQEPQVPNGIQLSNLFAIPAQASRFVPMLNLVTMIQRVPIDSNDDADDSVWEALATRLRVLYASLFFRLRRFLPFTLSRLRLLVDDDNDTLQFILTGAVLGDPESQLNAPASETVGHTHASYEGVVLTPLCGVSARVVEALGMVDVHLVRESVEEGVGSSSAFSQRLLSEAQTLLRSKVGAMGGNAVLGLTIEQFKQDDRENPYALVTLSGDAYRLDFKTPAS